MVVLALSHICFTSFSKTKSRPSHSRIRVRPHNQLSPTHESLPVADHVPDFVDSHDSKATLGAIMEAMLPSVGTLVEGLSDSFSSASHVELTKRSH